MADYPEEGDKILKIIDCARSFNNWMYSKIRPYLCGDILEIGSGIGTHSQTLIKDFPHSKIILSDIDSRYIKMLRDKFKAYPNVSIVKLNLSDPSDFKRINQKMDCIFALNVLEHVKDDIQAINNVYESLRPNGKFIFLVPAHKFLFNRIDVALGHYRRYTKKEVIKKVHMTKFRISKMFYFNSLSIAGWYFNGSILRKEILNGNAMRFLNVIVPFLKFLEKHIFMNQVGISLIVILEKKD